MNGIELQDREFFAAIREGREPNASVAQVLPCYRVLHQLEQQLQRRAERAPRDGGPRAGAVAALIDARASTSPLHDDREVRERLDADILAIDRTDLPS